MPGFMLFSEEVKWIWITPVIAVTVLVIVLGLNSFLSREVNSDNVDFLLEKEYFKRNLAENGVLHPEKLDGLQIIASTGVLIKVGVDEYHSNKDRYDERVFCGAFNDKYRCHDFEEVYLVNDKLEIVTIRMVRKIA